MQSLPTFVEIGAWCGKSTLYLGVAAEASGAVLFTIDHHRGSEENQPGWEHHEADLVDPDAGRIDTLPHWRRTIADAGLEASVVGIVGDSPTIARAGTGPWLSASSTAATATSRPGRTSAGWSPHVAVGGWLAIHDVFPDPADGGRPRTSSTAPRSTRASSSRTAPAAACGCSAGSAPR